MPTYRKLIRDKMPAIIAITGKEANTITLSDEAFAHQLREKIAEELEEYLNTTEDEQSLEELADILELIRALSQVHGASFEELDNIRKAKAEERGAFEDKIYLIDVKE
ncbi:MULTISPECIES: nucleoside triphosphate pyrophosphohydrolase [Virgibacillus]|uniref:Phosphoribosyl-ATP pyrophosphohydrolase n=1 Tax=Virgibacillus kapii TaxID=1638645 RepID=A0ABQ2DCN4_9BACI|nr:MULTISPECIES: nucleoside triphosphate pyrophosphohydrolase [Virgibacillus]EQB38314.1 hypothetical protein M948_06965 [Virgibacillus sp. CM-4]MYL41020.1 phosphoribosyl-ATP pyrophosphohydrolase [Virgibacillus massiliensis]GGJ53608.1 hypothetical protein GCM10007111_14800 [Virgibacillus kapii]